MCKGAVSRLQHVGWLARARLRWHQTGPETTRQCPPLCARGCGLPATAAASPDVPLKEDVADLQAGPAEDVNTAGERGGCAYTCGCGCVNTLPVASQLSCQPPKLALAQPQETVCSGQCGFVGHSCGCGCVCFDLCAVLSSGRAAQALVSIHCCLRMSSKTPMQLPA